MPKLTAFVFRELKTPAELRDSFALRYRVFSDTPGLAHARSLDAASALDVDGHDRWSRHFGLFARREDGDALVAALRVTGLDESPHVGAMRVALAEYPSLEVRLATVPDAPLPMLGYHVERERIGAVVRAAVARGERVVEAGRLVMAPEYRRGRARVQAMGLARAFVAAVTAQMGFVTPADWVFSNCVAGHRAFYRAFGFRDEGPGAVHLEPALDGIAVVTLRGCAAWLDPGTRVMCQSLAAQLVRDGELVLDGAVSAAGNAAPVT